MPRFIRMMLTGVAFLLFIAGSGMISWLLIPLQKRKNRGLNPLQQRHNWISFFQNIFRGSVRMMELLGLHTMEAAPLPKDFPHDRAFVLIANHPTLIDVLFIRAVVPGVTCLVKSSLFHQPQLRRILEAAGDFPAPPPAPLQIGTTSVLDTLVKRLKAGFPVMLFPEGTRSPMWSLHRFRRGGVEAACRAGVPIVPVFIWSDPPTLKKGHPWYRVPNRKVRFKLDFFPIIETEGKDAKELSKELKHAYDQRLRQVTANERHSQDQG